MDIFYYAALFLSLLLLTKLCLHNRTQYENLPPSPLSLPVIGHLHLIKKPLHRALTRISDRYGPIVFLRFGSRPVLLITSPSAVEECFTKNDVIFANRPGLSAGKYLGYNYTTLLWASYGDHWRNLRRITSLEIFSSNRVRMFSGVRMEEIRSLIRQLFKDYDQGFKKVELKAKLFALTSNVMMQMIAGKRYYGEDVVDLKEAGSFREIVEETFVLSSVTHLGDYLPGLRWVDLLGQKRKLIRLHRKRDGFIQSLIDERRRVDDVSATKTTMIDVLLSLQEKEPEYYTDEIIKGILVIMLTAGTDTSSVTVEWAMSLLLNNPEALKKARAELHDQIQDSRLIEDSDLSKLDYLHRVINETLRLFPAAPVIIHESSDECTIGGFDVPRGTMLLVNTWAIHKDPKEWVEPMRFDPERFRGVEGYKLLPFGVGRRMCPASNLATRVVGLTLGALIQCFEWERVGEEVDMREGLGLTMPKANPLEAMYKPRHTMVNVLSQL